MICFDNKQWWRLPCSTAEFRLFWHTSWWHVIYYKDPTAAWLGMVAYMSLIITLTNLWIKWEFEDGLVYKASSSLRHRWDLNNLQWAKPLASYFGQETRNKTMGVLALSIQHCKRPMCTFIEHLLRSRMQFPGFRSQQKQLEDNKLLVSPYSFFGH